MDNLDGDFDLEEFDPVRRQPGGGAVTHRTARRRPVTVKAAAAPVFAPTGLIVGPRHVRTGARRFSSTLVVVGYPREVWPGWLEPLTSLPRQVDLSVHITPIDPVGFPNAAPAAEQR